MVFSTLILSVSLFVWDVDMVQTLRLNLCFSLVGRFWKKSHFVPVYLRQNAVSNRWLPFRSSGDENNWRPNFFGSYVQILACFSNSLVLKICTTFLAVAFEPGYDESFWIGKLILYSAILFLWNLSLRESISCGKSGSHNSFVIMVIRYNGVLHNGARPYKEFLAVSEKVPHIESLH